MSVYLDLLLRLSLVQSFSLCAYILTELLPLSLSLFTWFSLSILSLHPFSITIPLSHYLHNSNDRQSTDYTKPLQTNQTKVYDRQNIKQENSVSLSTGVYSAVANMKVAGTGKRVQGKQINKYVITYTHMCIYVYMKPVSLPVMVPEMYISSICCKTAASLVVRRLFH